MGHFRRKCDRCGADKANGTSLQHYPGEWVCRCCSYSNFSFRVTCHKCGKARGALPETEKEKKERLEAEEREQREKREAEKEKSRLYAEREDELAAELGWPTTWREDEELEEEMMWKMNFE